MKIILDKYFMKILWIWKNWNTDQGKVWPHCDLQWFLPNKLNSKHLFPSIQDSTSMHTKYWISLFFITLGSNYLWIYQYYGFLSKENNFLFYRYIFFFAQKQKKNCQTLSCMYISRSETFQICKFQDWINHIKFVIGSLGYLWVSHLLWIWLKSCRSIPQRRFRKLLSSAELSEVLRNSDCVVLGI